MKNIRIVHGTLMYPLEVGQPAPSSLKRGGISTPLR